MKASLKSTLLAVVFLTGAAVLVVEVVATRILSPYFGNTIYTFSSVIGVILLALSLGYYFGGKLADRNPSLKWFYGIILLSGLSVFFLEVLVLVFLPIVGYELSIVAGPLVASMTLFLIPSVLLGTLSPYAITILEKNLPKTGIGSISGSVYFWSTLGSIFGSLLAGFVLIPSFGVNKIIFSVGVLLVVIGFLGLRKNKLGANILVKLAFVSMILAVITLAIIYLEKPAEALYYQDGVYEKLTIYDGEYEGKPARFFMQDRSASGAMFLDSEELVYEYTKYFVLYKLFTAEVKNALAIGGGAYSIPKAFLTEFPEAEIDVVEIEPSLYSLAQKYLGLKDNPRLTNHIQDGRRFLHDSDKHYDLIFSDVYYSIFSLPAHFTSKEFFQIAKDRLSDDGVFIANIIGNFSRQKPSLMLSEIRTFRNVFPNSYFFAVSSIKQSDTQNVIFLGTNSGKQIEMNDDLIIQSDDPIIKGLPEKYIDLNRFELSAYPILTDNYAPVDYYTSKILIRETAKSYAEFEGKEALALIDQQLRYGPRYPGSRGKDKMVDFLKAELFALAEELEVQNFEHVTANNDVLELSNIIARFNPDLDSRILLGTHYDSKRFADLDKTNPHLPVPGANDSASGTAVLLELARYLANYKESLAIGVDLVFFDGEEGEEDLSITEWVPLGSTYFANNLHDYYPENPPRQVIIIDMVGDKKLNIYKEGSSLLRDKELVNMFWKTAREEWPQVFIDQVKYEIRDDHTPFQNLGIPSMLIIDYDYPPFHTTEDSIDKCSARSLEIAGKALIKYLDTI